MVLHFLLHRLPSTCKQSPRLISIMIRAYFICCLNHMLHPRELLLQMLLSKIHQRSEEHTSELQSQSNLVCRLLLEKKNKVYYSPVKLLCDVVAPCLIYTRTGVYSNFVYNLPIQQMRLDNLVHPSPLDT